MTNLGTSEFKNSYDPTCSRFGNKWKDRNRHLSPSWREVTSCQLGTKSEPITDDFNFCSTCAEVIFIPDELSEILLPDKLSGSCTATSDQLGPKWYKEIQSGKQGKVVPLYSFCRFPSGTIYAKLLARANIPVTLRTISVILAARVFNHFRKRTSSQIETKFF